MKPQAARPILLLLVSAYLTIVPLPLRAQSCIDYRPHMRWVSSFRITTARDIAVRGNQAYVATGFRSGTPANGFTAIDISDPSAPISAGRVDIDEPALAVALLKNHALLAAGVDGLVTIDIRSPIHVASTIQLPGVAMDVATEGSFAYVACADSGLVVVDVTAPDSPVVVSRYDTPGSAWVVLVREAKVYLSDGYEGVKVIEVSNPSLPALIGELDVDGAGDLALAGDVLSIASPFGLELVDISNESKPVVIGRVPTPGGASAVATDGHTAFVAAGFPDGGIFSFDVTDPANPALLGTIGPSEVYRSLTLSEGLIYGTLRSLFGDLQIIDVSHPTSPPALGQVDSTFAGVAVSIVENQALMVTEGYLYNIDASEISRPFVTGWALLEYPGTDIDVIGSYAYVSEGATLLPEAGPKVGTLQIFDVSGGTPVELTSVPGYCTSVDVVDSLAFVAAQGLAVLNVKDPTSPSYVNRNATPGVNAHHVAVDGRWAYVIGSEGTGNYKLYVVDVSDPASAHITGSCQGYGDAVAVEGEVVCAVGYGILETFDVSDPEHPIRLTYVPIPATLFMPDVTIDHERAYVGTSLGVMAFDLSRPETPQLIGEAPVAKGARGVGLGNGLVYAGGGYGLSIYPMHCRELDPVEFGALEAWPMVEGIQLRWQSNANVFIRFWVDRALGREPSESDFMLLNAERPVPGKGPWEFLDKDVSLGRSYCYKIRGERRDGGEETIGPVVATAGASPAPGSALLQAAPNPASNAVTLHFELARGTAVQLEIYDATGHLVRRVQTGAMAAGSQTVVWDGRNGGGNLVASGRYVARVSWSGGTASTGIVLLRD